MLIGIPAVWTYYPWYHPNRPKFFNQATLYLDIIAAIKFNAVRYVQNVRESFLSELWEKR